MCNKQEREELSILLDDIDTFFGTFSVCGDVPQTREMGLPLWIRVTKEYNRLTGKNRSLPTVWVPVSRRKESK